MTNFPVEPTTQPSDHHNASHSTDTVRMINQTHHLELHPDTPAWEQSPEWVDYQWKDVMGLSVQVFDTDCFAVMWHGAYTKWLEMGRVKLLERYSIILSKPGASDGYIYPVVEQQFRYKQPAKFGDQLELITGLSVQGHKLFFKQCFYKEEIGRAVLAKPLVETETVNLVVDMQWRLQRRLPAEIAQKLGIT